MNADRTNAPPLVARIFRGAFVESAHQGVIAVAGGDGRLLFTGGDASLVSGLRSSAKPFQLLPLVESGAADRYGFAAAELAVMAGSHAGRPEHVEAVLSILDKAEVDVAALRCGAHLPFDADAVETLIRSGQRATALHNNCSGKHAGMLALAQFLGEPLDSYLDPRHPVQKRIRSTFAAVCDIPEDSVGLATDGCSAPTYFVSVAAAAAAFGRLAASAAGAAGGTDGRAAALGRIRDAMMEHPGMVAGPGRFDTQAMRGWPGLCAKGGAEGYQGLALKTHDGRAFGVAVKIEDGGGRAAGPVALEALRQVLGGIPTALEPLRAPVIKNHRGTDVGRLEPAFRLSPASPA